MFYNKKIYIILFLLSLSMLFAGCSRGRVNFDLDLDDNALSSSFGKNSLTLNWSKNKTTSTEELTINDVKASSVDIQINMGSIEVEYSEDDTLEMDIKYEAAGKEKVKVNEILDTVGIKYDITKDKLTISAINKATGENIWKWMEDKYNENLNLCIYLDLKLPKSMKEFYIVNQMGEIKLDSLKGAFDISNSMGEVGLMDVTFEDQSEVHVSMGSIDCTLSNETMENSEVTMDVDMGDISIDLNHLPYKNKKADKEGLMSDTASVLVQEQLLINTKVSMGEVTVK